MKKTKMSVAKRVLLFCMFVSLFSMERSIAENAKPTVGSIQNPKIEVSVKPAEPGWIASVQIEYQLRGGPSHKAAQAFPIPRPLFTAPNQAAHQIWVDGKLVPSETVLLDTSSPSGLGVGRGHPMRTNGEPKHWKPMMADWIASDPALQQMVNQHAKLVQRAAGYNEAFRAFEDRVKEHLIHKDLWTAALYVAQGDTYPSYLVSLIPEVDPTLRIDRNYQRWQYISLLESSSRRYQPYYEQWRKQANDWLESKANLAELLPALRTGYSSNKAAKELLQTSILKHLHDERGLSLQTSLDVASYIDSRSRQQDAVPEFLARSLFPTVRKSLDDAAEQQKREFKAWGYDLSQVSRITGNLCDQRFDLTRIYSGDHEPTVAQALGRTLAEDTGRHNHPAVVPYQTTFQVPLADGETADIRIQYDLTFGSLPHPMESRLPMHSELIVPFPPLDQKVSDVPVTITIQKPVYTIVSPPQDSIKIHADKSRTIQTHLTAKMPTLHLCLFRDLEGHVQRVRMGVGPSLQDIQELQSKIQNPSALALLKAVVCRQRSNTDLWAAAKMAERATKDHPELGEPWELMQPNDAKRLKELQQWIDTKAVDPAFTEEDWKHQGSENHLPASVAKELAERAKGLDASKLNLAQQAGRLFISCEAGIDYDRNLAELVGIGVQDTDSVLTVLTLIKQLSKPKTDAIAFVLDQQKNGSHRDHRIVAAHALRTFRSADSAKHLVGIAATATDAILIQVIFGVLKDSATRQLFESLVVLDQVAESASESAFISYLDSMLRSNRKLAIPRLKELFAKYPKHQSIILDRWSDAVGSTQVADQKAEVLRLAIRRYNTSDDPGSAAGVISDLATPTELGELSYRKSLKRWENESIVRAIASRGDKSAYGFVESFYHEFVKGVPDLNHDSCVKAFQQVGDPKASPLLREIVSSTKQIGSVATALGYLSLNRTLPAQRYQEHPLDQWLQVAVDRNRSAEERRDAVTKLLADRPAAAQRLVHHSPLRHELAEPEAKWRHGYGEKYGVLAPLGDAVVQELLGASDDCSLQQRYYIANLLQVFLPASNDRIESVAAKETVNSDRRLTAKLAIQLSTSAK